MVTVVLTIVNGITKSKALICKSILNQEIGKTQSIFSGPGPCSVIDQKRFTYIFFEIFVVRNFPMNRDGVLRKMNIASQWVWHQSSPQHHRIVIRGATGHAQTERVVFERILRPCGTRLCPWRCRGQGPMQQLPARGGLHRHAQRYDFETAVHMGFNPRPAPILRHLPGFFLHPQWQNSSAKWQGQGRRKRKALRAQKPRLFQSPFWQRHCHL